MGDRFSAIQRGRREYRTHSNDSPRREADLGVLCSEYSSARGRHDLGQWRLPILGRSHRNREYLKQAIQKIPGVENLDRRIASYARQ